MAISTKKIRQFRLGVAFILPNLVGFLAFTAVPLVISMYMAFTNWNLDMHNMFRNEPVSFIGLRNFTELLRDPDFFRFLGNTLFFMAGMPFGIAGSLFAALMLDQNLKWRSNKTAVSILGCIAVVFSISIMMLLNLGTGALAIMICTIAGLTLFGGGLTGQSWYRTMFYIPHFTSGVATFILWKKLYAPETGPVNQIIRPVLELVTPFVAGISPGIASVLAVVLYLAVNAIFIYAVWRITLNWRDSEMGTVSLVAGIGICTVMLLVSSSWCGIAWAPASAVFMTLAALAATIVCVVRGREFPAAADRGLGDAIIINAALLIVGFILAGLANVLHFLPQQAVETGLRPPEWLTDYYWAKPSIMLMGLWGAIGSNTMLLYLAGLSGIPQDLYEAADIDGAGFWRKFWHITWPQLSNITFFVLIMGVIGGLQGGFEMARAMTNGGPAGATTTLSYYIYTEGFAAGRLGYASAVSWTLFAMVFSITLINWKFGNRYTNN
ncbi:MAG: ABC transporter permease subunit [Victivallales bacterium]|nr:ABC transporter permease subunit [Victivallales bacterium]